MTKLYGSRWKITDGPRLGQGGQSEVFRVVDISGEHVGEFALKRVLNPERHARFRNEVEAIKRLSHPSVVKLVDHSALSSDNVAAEKQFLVMPIAKDGDLSRPERLTYYKGSIESVLQVAKQIASGLSAAHAAGIIHRDIKPQNILFTGMGHEVWVSDFGICLLREKPRVTPDEEVLGPRVFMAPELEDGGQLDVTVSADLYALGKVIFYMYSGGKIFSRERLHEPENAAVLENGERPRMLRLLLEQMICPLHRRIKTAGEVIERIEAIERWEQQAHLLPIGASGLAAIDKLQWQASERRRVTDENAAVRQQELRTLEEVKRSFTSWLEAELRVAASHMSAGGTLNCSVSEVTLANNHDWMAAYAHNRAYRPIAGFELRLEQPDDPHCHILQARLCLDSGPIVTVTSRMAGQPAPPPQVEPMRDQQLAFIPYYRQIRANQPPTQASLMGFLTVPEAIGSMRGQMVQSSRAPRQPPQINHYRVEGVTKSFQADISQHLKFLASEWPLDTTRLHEALTSAINAFADYVASGAYRMSL